MSVRNRFNYSTLNESTSDIDNLENQASHSVNISSKTLRIYICTWNVNTKQPDFDISQLLLFDINALPDICVFGFQEVNSKPLQRILDYFNNDPWTNQLTNLLSQFEFVRFESTRLVGNILNIFVKRPILPYIKCSSVNWLKLGFCGFWGNKGANIFSLNIGGFDICFVNTHLSAHANMENLRKTEQSKIVNYKHKLSTNTESVNEKDYLFFFGDLNFRVVNLTMEQIEDLIKTKQYQNLLQSDQLIRSMAKDKCFSDFEEDLINFAPTYKFKVNTNEHDKKRVPSWCDRVLFKLSKDNNDVIECNSLEYGSIPELNLSDHKPVYALYDIKVIDWLLELQQVEFMEITPNEDENLEVYYRVNRNVVTHCKDWIGVYDPEFKHSKDYVAFIWAIRIKELEEKIFDKRSIDLTRDVANRYIQRKAIIYQQQMNNGYYVLGYFSHVSNNLIGISNPFELKIS